MPGDARLSVVEDARAAGAGESPDAVTTILVGFEAALDPARATADGAAEVVGYGEVSTVLRLRAIPGSVCKRMAGFRDAAAVERYLAVLARYIELLATLGIDVAATRPVVVAPPARRPVVYLLQPDCDPRGFGSEILRRADEAMLLACLDRVLAHVRTLMAANRGAGTGRTLTVDAQLSNWHFALPGARAGTPPVAGAIDRHAGAAPPPATAVERQTGAPPPPVTAVDVGVPCLVDVGTPFMRVGGVDEIDLELFLAPVPPPFRAFSRWQRDVERYIDDYFDPRTLLLDLLGNFHKEGRPDRIPLARAHVNRWLAGDGAELGVAPLAAADVDGYYRRDAQKLELFLRLRRLDRWVRTRLLRQRYDFILPGPIRR